MIPEQAIQILIGRNQAFVNKQGKSTDYSRESDEIINTLLKMQREYLELRQNQFNQTLFASLCGIEAFPIALKEVPADFVKFILAKGFTEYQTRSYEWESFSSDPKDYYKQLIAAWRLHKESLNNLQHDIDLEYAAMDEVDTHDDWSAEEKEQIKQLHWEQIKAWEEDKNTLCFHG